MPLEGRPTQRRISQQAAPPPPFWKNLVAGGGAGLLEILCMYPTDVSSSSFVFLGGCVLVDVTEERASFSNWRIRLT